MDSARSLRTNHYLGDFPTDLSFYDEEQEQEASGVDSPCSTIITRKDTVSHRSERISMRTRSAVEVAPDVETEVRERSLDATTSPSPRHDSLSEEDTNDVDDNNDEDSASSASFSSDDDTQSLTSSSTSNEQVFLGKIQTSKERRLISKLNQTLGIDPSAATPPPMRLHTQPQQRLQSVSSKRSNFPSAGHLNLDQNTSLSFSTPTKPSRIDPLSGRLRKRDSREFNRRRSLAFSNRASIGGVTRGFEKEERDGAGNESVVEVKGDREWEGGFYDKDLSLAQSTSSSSSSSSSPASRSISSSASTTPSASTTTSNRSSTRSQTLDSVRPRSSSLKAASQAEEEVTDVAAGEESEAMITPDTVSGGANISPDEVVLDSPQPAILISSDKPLVFHPMEVGTEEEDEPASVGQVSDTDMESTDDEIEDDDEDAGIRTESETEEQSEKEVPEEPEAGEGPSCEFGLESAMTVDKLVGSDREERMRADLEEGVEREESEELDTASVEQPQSPVLKIQIPTIPIPSEESHSAKCMETSAAGDSEEEQKEEEEEEEKEEEEDAASVGQPELVSGEENVWEDVAGDDEGALESSEAEEAFDLREETPEVSDMIDNEEKGKTSEHADVEEVAATTIAQDLEEPKAVQVENEDAQTSPLRSLNSSVSTSSDSPLPVPRQRTSTTHRMSTRSSLRGEGSDGRLGSIHLPALDMDSLDSPVASFPITHHLDHLVEEEATPARSRGLGSPVMVMRTPSRTPMLIATPRRMEPLMLSTATPQHPLLTASSLRPSHTLAPGPSRLFKQPALGKIVSTTLGEMSSGLASPLPTPLVVDRSALISPKKQAKEDARRQAISGQLDAFVARQGAMMTPQKSTGPPQRLYGTAKMSAATPQRLFAVPAVPSEVPAQSAVKTTEGPSAPQSLAAARVGPVAKTKSTLPPATATIRKAVSPVKQQSKGIAASSRKLVVSRIPQKQTMSALPKPTGTLRLTSSLHIPARTTSDSSSLSSTSSARPVIVSAPARPKPGGPTLNPTSLPQSPAKRVPRPGMMHPAPMNSPAARRAPLGGGSAPIRPGSSLGRKAMGPPTPTRSGPPPRSLALSTARPVQPRFIPSKLGAPTHRSTMQVSTKEAPRPPPARGFTQSITTHATILAASDAANRSGSRSISPASSETTMQAIPAAITNTTTAASPSEAAPISVPAVPAPVSGDMVLRTADERSASIAEVAPAQATAIASAQSDPAASGQGGSSSSGQAPTTSSQDSIQDPSATTSRPKRAVKPITPAPPVSRAAKGKAPVHASSSTSKTNQPSIATMTDAQIRKLTELNRARNEVYFSAISKAVVKKEGPRPSSPGMKTIAEKEEEERKVGRGSRAKNRRRRSGSAEVEDSEDQDQDEKHKGKGKSSAVEAPPTKHVRAPGDEEQYSTPARGYKKSRKSAKTESEAGSPHAHGGGGLKRKRSRATSSASIGGKFVRWDKGLVVHSPEALSTPLKVGEVRAMMRAEGIKSCVKEKSRIQLDHLGNHPNAMQPVPNIKRTKVNVAVICYDGEETPVVEPVMPPAAASVPVTKGKGKK